MNELMRTYKDFVWKTLGLVAAVWGIIVYVGLIM